MAYGVLNTSVASAIGQSENEGLLTENRLAQKRKMTDKMEKAREGEKAPSCPAKRVSGRRP